VGWRVLPHSLAPAGLQLSRSEALWREVGAGGVPPRVVLPTLRWYGYSRPAVVLGVGQRLEAVDAAAAAGAGVQVERRTSGGTAVLADETMLALDVAVPAADARAGTDVLEAYRWLGAAIRDALAPLLVCGAERLRLVSIEEARADQRAQREAPAGSSQALRGLACFGTLAPYEVVLDGRQGRPARKLIGLSQVRKRNVVLFQVGLYATAGPQSRALARLLALPWSSEESPEGWRGALSVELGRRIAGLDDLGLTPGPDALRAAMGAIEGRLLND
jgi:lipoate---protein ligase